MKLKGKKALLLSSFAVATALPVSLAVSNLTTSVKTDQSSNLNFNSATGKAATTGSSYIFNNNSADPKEPTARQYYTTSTSGDSYAMITTTTDGGNSADQITKYSISGTNAGKMDWIISKNELKTDSGATTDVTIKSLAYASGETNSSGYLLVLVSDTSSSYLLKYNWKDGSKVTTNNKVTISDKDMQNITVVDQRNAYAMVFKAPKIATANQENKLDFYYVNNWASTPTKQELVISQTISNSNFSNGMYLREYKYVNKNIYLLYQSEKVAANSKSHAVVKVELKSGGTLSQSNLNANNISSYTLTSNDETAFGKDKTLFASLVDKGNNKDLSVVVKPKTDTQTTAKNESILISNFNTTSVNMNSSVYNNYPVNGGYISQIKPYYGSQNKLTGYLALDTSNKVVLLNTDLSVNSTMVDFGSNNTVYNIMTLKSSVDWYPQDKDGTFGDYYGSTLIGELGGTQTNTTELAPEYLVKTNNELDPSIKYRKISDDGATLNESFKTYLNTDSAYKDFLTIKSSDTRFGDEPIIKVTQEGSLTKGDDNTYSVQLKFTQTLRKRNGSGNITNANVDNELGTYTFKFINADGSIDQITNTTKMPVNFLNKLPSQVTLDETKQYLFNVSNVDGLSYTLNADDTKGTLSVSINVPYMWNNGTLVTNQTLEYTFDFFAKDILANYDTSVNLVTEDYINLDDNKDLLNRLSLSYSSKLPSEVSASDYLNDFVIKGSAFENQVLIAQGNIVNPTADNVTVTPIDNEGVAIVDVVFPRIGEKTNVKYSFTTAKIFKQNAFANQNFYFSFKENQQVLNYKPITNGVEDANDFSKRSASAIADIVNKATKENRRSILQIFATFSNYVGNLLNTTDSSGNDMVTINAVAQNDIGLVTVNVIFNNEIEGVNKNTFSQTFSGFTGDATGKTQGTASEFKFADTLTITGKIPSEITEADLNANNVFQYSGSASTLTQDPPVLEPINTYGQLKVTKTFYNWLEPRLDNAGNPITGELTVIPVKTFTKIYSGFLRTGDEQDMVVWKSFDELDTIYQQPSLSASDVVSAIKSANTTPLTELQAYANVTKSIEDYLNSTGNTNNLVLDVTYNDNLGTISIVANLVKNGKTQVFRSTIGGFATTDSEYSIIMVRDDSELANSMKNKMASEVTDVELNQLYTLTSGYENKKELDVSYDDINGELILSVSLLDDNGNVLTTQQSTYTGFVKNIPQYQGTDWLIFLLAVAIPTVVLIIPILFIKLYMDRRDIKRFSRTLNRRIDEENRKKKSKSVRSIKDLLDK